MAWRNTLGVTNAVNREWRWAVVLQRDDIDALIGYGASGVGFGVPVWGPSKFKNRRLKPAPLGTPPLIEIWAGSLSGDESQPARRWRIQLAGDSAWLLNAVLIDDNSCHRVEDEL